MDNDRRPGSHAACTEVDRTTRSHKHRDRDLEAYVEEVKRLAPATETLRELYLRSGNRCAFPGCTRPIVSDGGSYVAELCHIEAAMPGGPRFSSQQSNEDRRGYANLMLLCHEHHVETDDEASFPVGRMQEIKQLHEAKFSHIIEDIGADIVDRAGLGDLRSAKNLRRLSGVLGWALTEEQSAADLPEFSLFEQRMRELVPEARRVLAVLVDIATRTRQNVLVQEFEKRLGGTGGAFWDYLELLDKYELVRIQYPSDGSPYIGYVPLPTGWQPLESIGEFAKKSGVTLEELLVNLNFALLDE